MLAPEIIASAVGVIAEQFEKESVMDPYHPEGVAMLLQRVRLLVVALVAMLALAVPDAHAQPAKGKKPTTFNVVPITIQSVTVTDGQLMANGIAGTAPFQTPITLTPGAIPEGSTCPILNLSLGPINLDLLGLNVDTSPICLDITAVPGSGALLGNLLCAIAGLLNGGMTQSAVLAGLSTQDLATLDSGLTQLLNQAVFIPLTNSDALVAATCNVLSLAIGPVDLNLLGLRVELDDCANGPVTLDITADPAGGLLGNLLCALANLLNSSGVQTAVLSLLRSIAALIGALLG
jgi:hypothetical protein